MKSVIGIITCGFENERQFVSQNYIEAIQRSGALPLLLPILPFHSTDIHLDYQQYGSVCDGFLFCGGGDITPIFFDEEPLDASGVTDIKTDIFQLSFMEYVLSLQKPVLAICRGMQVLNTALGGTIYQDNTLIPRTTLSHMQRSIRRSDVSHRVSFEPGSILHSICGETTYTNSFHHQSVHTPVGQILISGRTSDGIIEAIEVEDHPFAVGVQWHPECMYKTSREMRNLFLRFVAAGYSKG